MYYIMYVLLLYSENFAVQSNAGYINEKIITVMGKADIFGEWMAYSAK